MVLLNSKQNQLHFWTSLSLALVAASAFLLIIMMFSSCGKSYLINESSKNHYLRCEHILGNVWDEGLLGPLGYPLAMQQDNIMVLLTTSALMLIVALLDYIISTFYDDTHEG